MDRNKTTQKWTLRGGAVLEPFAGPEATIGAAVLKNRRIIATDIAPEHMPLINARIDRFGASLSPVKKVKPAKARKTDSVTETLFK